MKKVFLCIFICLLSFFLMSHNVSAITSGGFYPDTAIGPFWVSPVPGDSTGQHVCNDNSNNLYITEIYTGLNGSRLIAGNDFLVAIPFFNPQVNNALDTKMPIQFRTTQDSRIWIKEVEIIQNNASTSTLYMILHAEETGINANLAFYSDDYIIVAPGECIGNLGWHTRIRWQGIANYADQLNALNSAIQNLNNNMPTQQSINNINNSINNLNTAVENSTQNASNDAATDAGDSETDVSSATTNLIGVMSQVVNTLTTTQATDCNIPMGFAHFGLGLVNVCSDVPSAVLNIVRGVSALVFVPIIVNYALYLVNKMIYLFRSFQE